MLAWRICRRKYQALDGEGARLHGGRWNSPGVPVVYASSSLSLAALEYLVHLDREDVPRDLVAMRLEIPDEGPVAALRASALPRDWRRYPAPPACAAAGDAWASRGEALVLRVPSAVVPEETNLLINPRHPRAGEVRVAGTRPFAFDPRLV